jgi:hypothetical protein
MNMKRGLVFSLCALAVAVSASSASAQAPTVSLSLNLRYTDPADPSEGGTWQLVAETNSANGIAGISAYISNINTAGMVYGNGGSITAATLGAILNGGNPYNTTIGTAVNVVYGQDTAAGPIVAGVGRGDAIAAPGEIATDPLRNATWNGASLIASGTFAGGGAAGNQFNRPAFVVAGANSTDANTLSGLVAPANASIDATTTTIVRGDSQVSFGLNANPLAGLRPGDANRDGAVGAADFSILSGNFGGAPPKGWDTGDFNDSGTVDAADFSILSGNFGQPAPPAPISAVPEPSSALLLSIGLLALGRGFKRS